MATFPYIRATIKTVDKYTHMSPSATKHICRAFYPIFNLKIAFVVFQAKNGDKLK